MAKKLLTPDESASLMDLLHHEGMRSLWKEAQEALELIQKRVIEFNLDKADKQNDLILLKARAEGAAQLLAALKVRLSKKPLAALPPT